jgi:hypothetical protein
MCIYMYIYSAFFLGGRRGTRTPKHFVNLMGESKNFTMVISFSQTESTPKHFFRKKSSIHIYIYIYIYIYI